MPRTHVKRHDEVVVIAGADKGMTGKVLSVDRDKGRVVVEGVNVRKKHTRRSQTNPEGGIVDKECPVDISNVMNRDKYEARRKAKGVESED